MGIRKEKKSALRVDLTGGFLDIWPVYLQIPEVHILNFSIPYFTHSRFCFEKSDKKNTKLRETLLNQKTGTCHFKALLDFKTQARERLSSTSGVSHFLSKKLSTVSPHFRILHIVLNHFLKEGQCFKTLTVEMKCDLPSGLGLAGSSSLMTSLVSCCLQALDKKIPKKELLFLCRDLEAKLLEAHAGWQDYVPALSDKAYQCYLIKLRPGENPDWKEWPLDKGFIKSHLLLLDTGVRHHSGNLNQNVLISFMKGNKEIKKGLCLLRDNSIKMKEVVKNQKWDSFFALLNKEQSLREQYFPGWMNKKVGHVLNKLRKHEGVLGFKLCGAGGGGALLVYTKGKKQKENLAKLFPSFKM